MTAVTTLGAASAAVQHRLAANHRSDGSSNARTAQASNSADKTSTVTNADGSVTTTVSSTSGAIVSISTTGGTGAGVQASVGGNSLYATGGTAASQTPRPAELLSLLV